MKKKKIARALQDLSNRLDIHIGAGNSEHMIADNDCDGFMSTEQVKKLGYAMGDKLVMPAGTDIFKLPPGHYAGAGFKGGTQTDAAWEIIDIYRSTDSYWQYWETLSYSGEVFFQNRHLGGDGAWNNGSYNGWQKIEKYAPLWSGNLSKVGTEITMVDEWRKFSSFRITVDNHNAFQQAITVKRAEVVSPTICNLEANGITKDMFEASIKFNGKKATLIENIHNRFDSTMDYAVTDSVLNIMSIEGVI